MTIDPFQNVADDPVAPAKDGFAAAPDDLSELIRATKAIFVRTGGDVVLRSLRCEQDVTFVAALSDAALDVRVCAIRATRTTASNIVGLA